MCRSLLHIPFVAIVLLVFSVGTVVAQEREQDESRVLVVVPISAKTPDAHLYRQIDKVVGELRKVKNKTITLECSYTGRPDREKDVVAAYKIAGRVEKYLRVNHKLDLDMWIAIRLHAKQPSFSPALTLAVM